MIQSVGVGWVLGAAVIVALTMNIEGIAGALLGTLAGYLFGMLQNGYSSGAPLDPSTLRPIPVESGFGFRHASGTVRAVG